LHHRIFPAFETKVLLIGERALKAGNPVPAAVKD